jgi:hypothetical protein
MWGSLFIASIRHNDKGTVNASGLNDYLMDCLNFMELPEPRHIRPALFGDDIFEETPVIVRKQKKRRNGGDVDEEQKAIDLRLSSLRQSIELGYGLVFNLFKILRVKNFFQLYKKADEVREMIYVCFFLCNCYTCLNGNVANSIFDSKPPTLEEYLPLDE